MMKENRLNLTHQQLLTPLEKELLNSVEKLAETLSESNEEHSKALQNTISLLLKRQEALEASYMAFQDCQTAFNSVLIGWARDPQDKQASLNLKEAIQKLEQLNQTTSPD